MIQTDVDDVSIEADEEGFCVDAMWKAFRPKPRTASAGKTRLSEFINFFLEIIEEPNHPEYEEMLEWIGGEFNPEYFDVNEIRFRGTTTSNMPRR